ncbi:MAG TPA: YesL family protein [Clostridiales bacterium]|nr:YesL family protein [Clostridiales bacterium]
MSFFSPDNAFFRLMTKVCQGAVLSLLWLLCSLPLFTAGAATAALSSVMLRLVRDEEGYLFQSFFKAFLTHFKQATAVWLLFVAALILIGGDIFFFVRMGSWAGILIAGLFFAVLIVLLLALQLVFYYLVWYPSTLRQTLAGSFRMALGYLPYSGALLILLVCMGYGFYVSVPLMIIFAFFGMGIFGYIGAYLWRRVFDKLEQKKGGFYE